jgi:ATP-dependent protease ClpP protease subunit
MITARRVEEADGTIRMDWAPLAKLAPAKLLQDGVIRIGGTIDPGSSCNARSLRSALAEWPRTAPLVVEIDSTGGSLAEGIAMYLALKCDPRHVTLRIPRLAASAASIIACAGDRIEIAESARFEIHDSRITDTKGWPLTSARLQVMAETLAEGDAQIRDILGTRCKCSRGWLAEQMHRERAFIGHEAVEVGFADTVIPNREEPIHG